MSKRTGVLLALVTAAFWGTMPIAGKIALDGISPYFISWFRFVTAALILGGLLWWQGRAETQLLRRPPLLMVVAAAGLAGNYILYIAGLQYTTATAAQFIVQTGTIFLVTWSALFLGERVGPLRVIGVAITLGGVFLVTWNGESLEGLWSSDTLLGNLMVMGSALSWSLYAVLQKRLGRDHSAAGILLVVYASGAVLTLPAGVLVPAEAPWWAWVALLFLVVNTIIAYGAFAESLRHVDAAVTSTVAAFAPVLTVVGVAIANHFWPGSYPGEFTLYTLAGGTLILVGIVVVLRSQ
ncbi:MAG TPA: DMT family transporter [Candidatus Thermoplasmatota archaeon]|nr:DMT family transporter [Candidatus Thermoplasmatota archaeon]